MPQLSTGLLLAAQALSLAAIAWLAWRLRREVRAHAAAGAELAERIDSAEEQAARLALFDRRAAAIAPIDTLWLSWSNGCRPANGDVVDALKGMQAARLLFADGIGEALEEASALLLAYIDQQQRQQAIAGSGRYYDREDALGRELALEAEIRAVVASLRPRLAAEARIEN